MKYSEYLAELQKSCDYFNKKYPVGTPVLYWPIQGPREAGATTSPAHLSNNIPVVKVNDRLHAISNIEIVK